MKRYFRKVWNNLRYWYHMNRREVYLGKAKQFAEEYNDGAFRESMKKAIHHTGMCLHIDIK